MKEKEQEKKPENKTGAPGSLVDEKGKQTPDNQPTIEALARQHHVSNTVLAGMMAMHRWGRGKRIPADHFLVALKKFLTAPAAGGKA